ncbi:MAG: M23 family metallopeptidase [Treponema sp.]|nr:M23 family metallopeptidase [Treponema sp.]
MKSLFLNKLKKIFLFSLLSLFGSVFLYSDSEHVVEKGETLYSISKKYKTTVQEIAKRNNISGTDIKVGQKLVIPEANLGEKKNNSVIKQGVSTFAYTVKKGDTWYGIARKYLVPLNELYSLNNADPSSALKIGQKIKIPEQKDLVTNDKKNNSDNKIKNDLANLNPKSVGKKGDSSLVWPVENPDVTYVNGKVSGVNLSAKSDEKVNAIMAGTVMFSGSYRGFGNVVFIQSKTGHIYAYTGLGKVLVSKGDYIDFKSQIGTVGINGYSSKPQISLMVFQNGLPIDPAKAPRG